MAPTNLTETDVGKNVVGSNGERLGTLSKFEGGMGYVEPEQDMAENIRSKFGWASGDETEFELQEAQIDEVTDNEIRLTETA